MKRETLYYQLVTVVTSDAALHMTAACLDCFLEEDIENKSLLNKAEGARQQ